MYRIFAFMFFAMGMIDAVNNKFDRSMTMFAMSNVMALYHKMEELEAKIKSKGEDDETR